MNGAAESDVGSATIAHRDRDPPPAFDGKNPDELRRYLRDLKLWRWETDTPKVKHAVKMLRQLSGPARAAADELSVEVLMTEEGADGIVTKLKEHFQPHLEAAMPRAFERAVYGESRRAKESLQEYVIRCDQAFKELADEEVQLPEIVRGYIIFRQCNLSQTQEDQVTTWTQGRYEREHVVKALRKLEKVHREKMGNKSMLAETEEGEVSGEIFGTITEEGDEEIEQYVYLADGDLDQVYDEDEVHAALATYQQVRKAIREQKNARGFKGGKAYGRGYGTKVNNFGGKLQFGQTGTKVHIESLKLRTRCARCGMVGHWAKECTNQPDDIAKRRQDSGSAASSSVKTSNMSGKSGFVHLGSEGSSMVSIGESFSVGLKWDPISLSSSIPWSMTSTSSSTCMHVHEPLNLNFLGSDESLLQFCGVTTHGEFGLVDTAAQSGLIGIGALDRLNTALGEHGLKAKWTNKAGNARGVGGEAKCKGVVEIPLGVGGVCGVLEATVVQEDVPLLLPVKLLRELRAVIDFSKDQLILKKFGAESMLSTLPSGHVAVSITDFGKGGWQLPVEAKAKGLIESDFRVQHSGAMNNSILVSHGIPSLCPFVALASHELARAAGEDEYHPRSSDAGGGRCQWGGEKPAGIAVMAQADRQGEGALPSVRQSRAVRAGSLAKRWLCLWMVAAAQLTGADGTSVAQLSRAFHHTRDACHANPVWCQAGTAEEPSAATGIRCNVRPPGSVSDGWRESTSARSVVRGLSCKMEGGNHGGNTGGHTEDGTAISSANYTDFPEDHSGDSYGVHSNELYGNCGHSQCQGWDSVQMQCTRRTSHCEEGGKHEGTSLLQMPQPSVRLLPVGSGGNQDAAGGVGTEEHEEGARSQPGSLQTQRGAGDREEEAGRGASQHDPGASDGRAGQSREDGGDDGSSQQAPYRSYGGDGAKERSVAHGVQPAASAADGGEQHGLPKPCGSTPASSVLADHAGRGGAHSGGDERSKEVCRGIGTGEATEGSNELAIWRAALKQSEETGSLSLQDMSQLKKNAPWVCQVEGKRAQETVRRLQLEDRDQANELQRIQEHFWIQVEDTWQFHNGILPSDCNASHVVVSLLERLPDEDFMDEVDCVLNRGCRKRLRRELNKLVVSEVYSQPRVAQQAAVEGMKAGTSFDLLTGFDFCTRRDRLRCWRQLKKENPDLLIVCPPCGPFSPLQNLNYSRMEVSKAMAIVGEGLQHLGFAMELYQWQVLRGKIALFEHPAPSKAWEEECVKKALQLPGVMRVRADQCEFGLRTRPDEDLHRKPTDFMVNSRAMAQRLAIRCQGGHRHQELISGRAKKAEEYPPALCKAMLDGLKQEMKEGYHAVFVGEVQDDGDDDIEDALERSFQPDIPPSGGPVVAVPPPDEEEESGGEGREAHVPRGVSRQDKALIRKLHVNLGHPSKEDFARALRMSRAREEVWRYVKEEFRCDVCESKILPKPARPSTVPRHFETGKTVGVDVVYMPSHDPNKNIPVLNVVDWASCYQTLEPLDNTSSKSVWLAFQRSWCRTFGSPEIVVMDQGTEFQKDFTERASQAGSLIRTIGARAPWQQGRTERHGGIAKGELEKVLEQVGPVDLLEEWKMCIYAVEQSKNRLFNKSGFSPAQRQLGANLRMPGSLSSEDPYDAVLMRGTASQEMQRTLQIKEAAMEAFIKHTTADSISRASKARARTTQNFQKGDVVFVFRKPLPRKNMQTNREGRKPTWVGPGVVIMPEGANVWISMRGELWKCAKEQVRSATPQEEEAYGLLRDELEELQQEITRKASKRGFKDITQWGMPGEDDEDPME